MRRAVALLVLRPELAAFFCAEKIISYVLKVFTRYMEGMHCLRRLINHLTSMIPNPSILIGSTNHNARPNRNIW